MGKIRVKELRSRLNQLMVFVDENTPIVVAGIDASNLLVKIKNKQYSPFKYNVYGNDLSVVDSALSSGVVSSIFFIMRRFLLWISAKVSKIYPDTAILMRIQTGVLSTSSPEQLKLIYWFKTAHA